MEETNEDSIRYRFTSYVSVALKRARRDYINREIKISSHEILLEEDEPCLELSPDCLENLPFGEEAGQIPLTPAAARQYLESQVGDAGRAALDTLTEREILVVFLKVFGQLTYEEIGRLLGVNWKKAGSVYTYARKKMQKGWDKWSGV